MPKMSAELKQKLGKTEAKPVAVPKPSNGNGSSKKSPWGEDGREFPPRTPTPPPLAVVSNPAAIRAKLNPDRLKRSNRPEPEDEEKEPLSVSAGPIARVIELSFNPSREKMREMTVIDRFQGRLFPQVDMINSIWHYLLEISFYRMDKTQYIKVFKRPMPIAPDDLDELLYRTAQWQKSIQGLNLGKAVEVAMIEQEKQVDEDGTGGGADPFKE